MSSTTSPIPGTQVLSRSIQVLHLMAIRRQNGVQVRDLVNAFGFAPPTAHRLLQGLLQERLADYDPRMHRYFLGPALYELGLTAAERYDLMSYIQPSVDRLVHETEDTVVATIRSGLDSVCIEHRIGAFPIRTSVLSIGTRRPLCLGSGGMTMLSRMNPEEASAIVEENCHRMHRDPAEFENMIESARTNGYALKVYEIPPSVTSIGIPIIGAYSQCVAGLSVVALSSRLYGSRRDEVINMLEAESRAITRRLTSTPSAQTPK